MPCARHPRRQTTVLRSLTTAGLLAVLLAGPAAAQSGLDARPANNTCVALPRPVVATGAALQRVFPNLSLIGIIAMYQAPGDASRWYLVRQPADIYRAPNVD